MMEIKTEVDKIVGKITLQAKSRAFRAANTLKNSALEVLRGQRSGRIYRAPFSKRKYTASAPGEPPAVRSGDLRRSWRPMTGSEGAGDTLTIKPAIVTNVEYAPYLEHGTKKGMAPRPFEERIIQNAMPKVTKIFSEPYIT